MQAQRSWTRSLPARLQGNLGFEPKPLHSLLEESATRSPDAICLSYQRTALAYGRVNELASRFAASLIARGLQRGHRVAIFSPNTPQFVVSYFGTLKAGGTIVPCSPLYKARELEFQLRDSGATFVVAASDIVKGNDLFASLEACRGRLELKGVITASVTEYLPTPKRLLAGLAGVKNVRRKDTIPFAEMVVGPALESPVVVDPLKDLAALQYTGGTTGTPKGAMLSHANLYFNAVLASIILPLGPRDVALAALPLFHIYGMTTSMNAPIFAGSRIVLLPRFEVEPLMKTIQRERVTSFCGVPAMYIAINNNPRVYKYNLRTIRRCIAGGAPLPIAVRKKFMELTGATLVEGYGLTEASPVTHCNPLDDGSLVKDGSIGIPLPETDARVVDMEEPTRILAPEAIGELAVKGPQVMLGYWKNKAESENVLKDGWLLTGDIAKMDADGYFFIVDRKKDMINVGGFKVYPREVEEVLFAHPDVREAAVVGLRDEFRGEVVRAYVVPKSGRKGALSEQLVIDYCRNNLASYKAPKSVVLVDELPKNLVGKVLRRKLRDRGDWEKEIGVTPPPAPPTATDASSAPSGVVKSAQ